MNKIDRNRIEAVFQGSPIQEIAEVLAEYEEVYPYDRDLKFYKCAYYMVSGQMEMAQEIISDCLRKFPSSYEAYYYQASIYQGQGKLLEALKYYEICLMLYNRLKINDEEILEDVNVQREILVQQIGNMMDEYAAANDKKNLQCISDFLERGQICWGMEDHSPRDTYRNIVGRERLKW